jgi:hypothetical protein
MNEWCNAGPQLAPRRDRLPQPPLLISSLLFGRKRFSNESRDDCSWNRFHTPAESTSTAASFCRRRGSRPGIPPQRWLATLARRQKQKIACQSIEPKRRCAAKRPPPQPLLGPHSNHATTAFHFRPDDWSDNVRDSPPPGIPFFAEIPICFLRWRSVVVANDLVACFAGPVGARDDDTLIVGHVVATISVLTTGAARHL